LEEMVNYSVDSGSQGEILIDSQVTVRFTGVYDGCEDRPRMNVVGSGRTVDDAWRDACNAMAREVSDMSYDDWEAA
jgi:hypothetical protein